MAGKKLISIAIILTLVCAMLSGIAAAEGKHMNAALYWFGTSLDPATEYDGWTTSRAGITETLVTVNENYEVVAQIADSWEQIDDMTWKMHVREGVTFHNGKTVDAEAVKKCLERTMELNNRAITTAKIESIEADGMELIFHNTQKNAAFPATMTEPLYSIYDAEADTDFFSCPIGTGPFMVKGFEVDTFIELEAYKGYWNGASDLDTVTVKCIADDNTRGLAVQSGEIDIMQRIASNDLPIFNDNANFNVYSTLGARTRLLVMDHTDADLSDVRVRKALAASFNYDALVAILGGTVNAAGAPFPASAPYGYDELDDKQHYDPDMAKALLEEAGYADTDGDGIVEKDGRKLTLTIDYTNAGYTVMLEACQAMARACGIDLQLNLVDSIMEKTHGEVAFNVVSTNWQVLSTGDPQWFLDTQYRTGADNNGGHYSNPKLDELADQLAAASDIEERRLITIEAEKVLLEDCAGIYLVGEVNFILANSNVQNVTPYPIDYYFLDNAITIA